MLPLIELRSQRSRPLRQLLDRLAAGRDLGHGLAELAGLPLGLHEIGRHDGDVRAQPFGFLDPRRQADEPLLGGLHAGLELLLALVQPRPECPELGHPAVQVVDELPPRLDRGQRLADALRLLLDHLDGGRHLVQPGDLLLELVDELLQIRQPGAGIGLTLPHAEDLAVGELRLLERVLHHRVGAVQLAQIRERRLQSRPRFLDLRHLGADAADRAAGLVQVPPDGAELCHLLVDLPNLLGEALQVRRQGLGLGPELAHGQARLGEPLEAVLAIRQGAAQVGHALAHRFEAAALEVETLHGPLHLVGERGEVLSGGARLLVGLALELGDLVGSLHHLLVQRPQRRDVVLQRGERLLVLLLLAHAGVELAHRPLELVRLGERPVDRRALSFERRGLLDHGVAQGLQRADLALDLVDRVLDAVHPAHRLLDAGDAPLLVLERAAQIVAPAVQGLHLRRRELVLIDEPVVMLAQPRQVLARPLDLPADLLGFPPQLVEGLFHLEEGPEAFLEIQGDVHLAAEVLEQRPDLLDLLERLRELGLGAVLVLGQDLGPLVEVLEPGRELRHRREAPFQLLEPRRHGLHLAAGLDDRLAELLELVRRGASALDEGFVAAALLLHLVQDRAHLLGRFPVLGVVSEQILEHGWHHTLLLVAPAARPGWDRRISFVVVWPLVVDGPRATELQVGAATLQEAGLSPRDPRGALQSALGWAGGVARARQRQNPSRGMARALPPALEAGSFPVAEPSAGPVGEGFLHFLAGFEDAAHHHRFDGLPRQLRLHVLGDGEHADHADLEALARASSLLEDASGV